MLLIKKKIHLFQDANMRCKVILTYLTITWLIETKQKID